MHPLAPDLSNLSDDELHKKRGDLQQKIMFAYRMGQGGMVGQIQLLIADYDAEIQRRNQKLLDEMSKNNPSFRDKIDISK